jgi:hypothetical protein
MLGYSQADLAFKQQIVKELWHPRQKDEFANVLDKSLLTLKYQ